MLPRKKHKEKIFSYCLQLYITKCNIKSIMREHVSHLLASTKNKSVYKFHGISTVIFRTLIYSHISGNKSYKTIAMMYYNFQYVSLASIYGLSYMGCELIMRHHSDVVMSAMASQITGVSIVYSTVCSGADQRKQQSSASLDTVRGIPRWPVNSPHKGSVTLKMFPFDDIIMAHESVILILFREINTKIALQWAH